MDPIEECSEFACDRDQRSVPESRRSRGIGEVVRAAPRDPVRAAGVAVDETFKRKRTGDSAGKVHAFRIVVKYVRMYQLGIGIAP